MKKHQFRGACQRAFSLIEVVLALGVVSFGFISVMGMVPVGLQNYQRSMDTAIRTQIVQHIFNEAIQTDFDTLVQSKTLADRYFDDQGIEVNGAQNYIYQVKVDVVTSTDLPSSPSSNPNLATLQIRIANNPGHIANPFVQGCYETSMMVAGIEARN